MATNLHNFYSTLIPHEAVHHSNKLELERLHTPPPFPPSCAFVQTRCRLWGCESFTCFPGNFAAQAVYAGVLDTVKGVKWRTKASLQKGQFGSSVLLSCGHSEIEHWMKIRGTGACEVISSGLDLLELFPKAWRSRVLIKLWLQSKLKLQYSDRWM